MGGGIGGGGEGAATRTVATVIGVSASTVTLRAAANAEVSSVSSRSICVADSTAAWLTLVGEMSASMTTEPGLTRRTMSLDLTPSRAASAAAYLEDVSGIDKTQLVPFATGQAAHP